jgi:hypothetical protein
MTNSERFFMLVEDFEAPKWNPANAGGAATSLLPSITPDILRMARKKENKPLRPQDARPY